MNTFLERIRTKRIKIFTKNNSPRKGNNWETVESVNIYKSDLLFKTFFKQGKIHDLKPSSLILLCYIILKLKKNQTSVELCFRLIEEEVGLGKTAFHKGIEELEALGFIAKPNGRKRSTEYHINPNFIYNGNRPIFWIDILKPSNFQYLEV